MGGTDKLFICVFQWNRCLYTAHKFKEFRIRLNSYFRSSSIENVENVHSISGFVLVPKCDILCHRAAFITIRQPPLGLDKRIVTHALMILVFRMTLDIGGTDPQISDTWSEPEIVPGSILAHYDEMAKEASSDNC